MTDIAADLEREGIKVSYQSQTIKILTFSNPAVLDVFWSLVGQIDTHGWYLETCRFASWDGVTKGEATFRMATYDGKQWLRRVLPE